MSERSFYLHNLYPLQDEFLRLMEKGDTSFYLTGGTALGRQYLHHRFSDDLDFFLNNAEDFKTQVARIIDLIGRETSWECTVGVTADSFLRAFVRNGDTILKVEFVNDVPYHAGEFLKSPLFSKIDGWQNILSNKISALSRRSAKDIVDIIFMARTYSFSWQEMIADAKKKDMWVDELAVSEHLASFDMAQCESIKWIKKVDIVELTQHRDRIARDIVRGTDNQRWSER